MNWNLEQAITVSALNLICSDGEVDQKELSAIYESAFFSKYVTPDLFNWYLELDLTNILDDVSKKFPDVFSKEDLSLKKELIYEMVNLSIADGDVADNELAILNHTAVSIGLSMQDVTDAIEKWSKKIKAEIKKLKLQNAKRTGFNFSEGVIMSAVLLIMIDGVIDDDEIETMKKHKFFSKHHSKGNESLAVTIMNDDDYSMADLISSELGEIFKKEKEETRIDFIDALIDLAGADGHWETEEMNVLNLVAKSMDMVDKLTERLEYCIKKLKLKRLGITSEQYDDIISQIVSTLDSGKVEDAIALYESSFSVENSEAKEEVKNLASKHGMTSKYEVYEKKEQKQGCIILVVIAVIVIAILYSC
tara:strand:- start:239 stop:1327 length:1089 start_codon:yes stop_codon:yes gene_type:complete